MGCLWQSQCMMLRIFAGEKADQSLHEEAVFERVSIFVFENSSSLRNFFVVVNGRVIVSFISSILKQETFLIAHCLS